MCNQVYAANSRWASFAVRILLTPGALGVRSGKISALFARTYH
ncbi:MAG TPA: hypothetical protein VGI45_26665 [Terracidiphilus sp.]